MNLKNVLVFGAGLHAQKVARAFQKKRVDVLGFVVSGEAKGSPIDNIITYSFSSLPIALMNRVPIACGVFNHRDSYKGLAMVLAQQGFENVIWPWEYYPYLCEEIGWCYWLDASPKTRQAWEKDDRYNQIMSILSDDESKLILQRTLDFRSGTDFEFSGYNSVQSQYFNDLSLRAFPKEQSIRLLDVGAFDGDTLKALLVKRPVSEAVLIEPDHSNFIRLAHNLKTWSSDIPHLKSCAIPVGAGSEYGTFKISGSGDAASLHSDTSADTGLCDVVRVLPLDDILPTSNFDIIKVDVEGHDLPALLGMKEIISRSKPTLLISLYHRPQDIIDIPLAIRDMLRGSSYEFYLRQHLNNTFESVMYALPA
jgi:FkbM family methyltransferase